MKSLGLKCKECGQLFATGIMMGVYGRPVMGTAHFACPSCRKPAQYANNDYVRLVS